jgi:hypothetical protein
MSESKEARNKALVLKAFGTLFNKRDYAAAERDRMRQMKAGLYPQFDRRSWSSLM